MNIEQSQAGAGMNQILSGKSGRIGYLDGLRAFAILAVLGYHYFPQWIPAGFLGVDLFFVLSGYLVGGLTVGKIRTDSFSVLNFVKSRFFRLAPVYIVVLASVLTAGGFLLATRDYERLAESTVWALAGVSNFFFLSESAYDLANPLDYPLLHTWSLSVELQFYVVLPLLLLTLVKRVSNRGLALATMGFAILTFYSSIALGPVLGDGASYYLPFARFAEMSIGLLAALVERRTQSLLNGWRRSAVASTAFLALVLSFLFLETLKDGPGLLSLWFSFLAAVVIITSSGSMQERLFGARVFRFLGKISYSLYLWHFPLLAFALSLNEPVNFWGRLGLIAISIALSTITYFAIERPIADRTKSSANRRSGRAWLIGFVAVAVTATVIFASGGLPQRLSQMPAIGDERVANHLNQLLQGEGPPVIFVGDSHLKAIVPGLLPQLEELGRPVYSWLIPGCPFLLDLNLTNKDTNKVSAECSSAVQEQRLAFVQSVGPSTVVWGSRLQVHAEGGEIGPGFVDEHFSDFFQTSANEQYSLEASRENISGSLQTTIKRLVSTGNRVVLIYPIPEYPISVPNALSQAVLLNLGNWPLRSPVNFEYSQFLARASSSYSLLDRVSGSGVSRFYPADVLCPDIGATRKCLLHSEAEIFYRDSNHLSLEGSLLLSEKLSNLIALAAPEN